MKRDELGFIICPNCGVHFEPELGERKTSELIQVEFPDAKPYQREQLITGICSDLCFDEYCGIRRRT